MLTFTHVLFFVIGPQRSFDFKVCVAISCIMSGKVEGSTLLHETTGTGADCLGMLGRILAYRKNLFACIHH